MTAEFVTLLREVVAEQGRPKWETVLAADSPDASTGRRNGFTQLLRRTWARLEEHVRAAGNSGIVLLHDATPLARYTGGVELLAKLAVAARDRGGVPAWPVAALPDGGPAGPAAARPDDGQRDPRRRRAALRARRVRLTAMMAGRT